MLSARTGVGLTTTSIERCGPSSSQLGGCEVVATPRPLNLVATVDGGRSWRITGTPVPGGQAGDEGSNTPAFWTVSDGYVLADHRLWHTGDAGRHWVQVHLPGQVEELQQNQATVWAVLRVCPAGAGPGGLCPTHLAAATADVPFGPARPVPAAGVLVVGRLGPDAGAFFEGSDAKPAKLEVTADDGRSWTAVGDPCGQLPTGALAGVDDAHWWLVCDQGGGMNQGTIEVFGTDTGGRSWTLQADADEQGQGTGGLSDSNVQQFAVSPDGRRLWLVGVNLVQTSTDGGRNWTTVGNVNLEGAFVSVSLLAPEQAWLAAGNQGMWATANGATWAPLGPTGLIDSPRA